MAVENFFFPLPLPMMMSSIGAAFLFAPPLFWIMKWQIIEAASFGAFLGVLCPSGCLAAKDLDQQLKRTSQGAGAPKIAPNNSTVGCLLAYVLGVPDRPFSESHGGLCLSTCSPLPHGNQIILVVPL